MSKVDDMSKHHSLFILLIALPLALAPLKADAQFSFGVKTAWNTVSLDNFQDFSGGFDLGAFFRIGRAFFFQPEVNYSFRNTDFQHIIGEFRENYRMRQHFLDIPLLIGHHFLNNSNFKLHFLVGPRVAVLINNHLLQASTVSDVASHLQWGGQIGLGIDVWRFAIDGRYDISADKTTTDSSKARLQNMFVVSLGFKFIK